MLYLITSIVTVLVLLTGAVWWYRRRQANAHRLVAIVGLQEKKKYLDASMIIHAAHRAWGADLGTADEQGGEGADGFVVGMEISHIIRYQNRTFMVNNFPIPYVKDPEATAERMENIRLSTIFAKHQSWFSCDAMGMQNNTPDNEVEEQYRLLGKLFAELLDDDCLGIFFPDSDSLFPINEETVNSLRNGKVLEAFRENAELPIVNVQSDNPAMLAAVAKSRETWPSLVKAFEAGEGKDFSAKVPITRGDNTEFIWLTLTALENDTIYGTLANEPGNLPGLALHSKVTASASDLNDWCYIDQHGEMQGGFTVAVVLGEMKKGKLAK